MNANLHLPSGPILLPVTVIICAPKPGVAGIKHDKPTKVEAMKLFSAKPSPYARKVLLLAQSLGFSEQIDIIITNPFENDPAFIAASPFGKVPALVMDDGLTVNNSPLLVEVFLDMAGQTRTGEAYFEALQIQALADGIMDAVFALAAEARKPDTQQSGYWKERWHGAIARGLERLDGVYIRKLSSWNIASIAAACALDYILLRLPDLPWQIDHPKLAVWFESICTRPDFQATDPR